MRHVPLFRDVKGRRVIVAGGGAVAMAKLRILLKSEARVVVYAADPDPVIAGWAAEGRLTLFRRPIDYGDATCAALLYAASMDPVEDARAAAVGRSAGALVNCVDNLEASDFITPAIVDRDPVVVAIGTEGASPVLARRIKTENEARLPLELGPLARIGKAFRAHAEALPYGRVRRRFWSRYYDVDGPRALAAGGEAAVEALLPQLLAEVAAEGAEAGRVSLVGAGPGDPDLLTLKARNRLHDADVIVYDGLVSPAILDLARREATFIEVGKTPGGPSWRQDAIDALLIDHARSGAHVVRLKSGDPAVFGRLDEEIDALEIAGVAWEIVPGITAAAAAAADIGRSLTRRGRNKAITLATGHDSEGFAEQDWRALAAPGSVAAIYMGLRAARFIQGRLMLHGADPAMPMTVVENASRIERRTVATTLTELPRALAEGGIRGPAILILGLAPRAAEASCTADVLSHAAEA